MLRGLFIGIDRHSSPSINWLSCACRDAKALHGLFTDTLGGQTTLLIDGQATRAKIELAVQDLSGASDDRSEERRVGSDWSSDVCSSDLAWPLHGYSRRTDHAPH